VSDALFWHRFQFGFTAAFHYIFPQLTMGLALVIVLLKAIALRTRDAAWDEAARFWTRIFGINFVFGVVTGIPLEFQFGTNWSRFSTLAGGVIGQPLAMEGLFAFFLESTTLGLVLFKEEKLGRAGHFAASVALCAGTWLSGYFIIVTNAFMQHPVAYTVAADGRLEVESVAALLSNPWAIWEYAHTMCASVVTASFVVAAVGAYYRLSGREESISRASLRVGVVLALLSSALQGFPTGDRQGKLVAEHQPAALATMEGLFHGQPGAPLAIIGQPDVEHHRLENPIEVPGLLSFLAYGTFGSETHGMDDYPESERPGQVELLYYAYHIMVGLGTILLAIAGIAALLLALGRLERTRAVLWALMLAFPFPYIATTAGWLTAELGRQPWVVHGVLRTEASCSPSVTGGDVAFTTLGFMGLYFVAGVAFLFLVGREIARGGGAQHDGH
jgi:cytochrome d ubiquinol oxidase subunit I